MENTKNGVQNTLQSLDHLHTRGEYTHHFGQDYTVEGSPPHTWRILMIVRFLKGFIRITSTHVENTLSSALAARSNKDHLHTRGEYKELLKRYPTDPGSPPHTWRIQ